MSTPGIPENQTVRRTGVLSRCLIASRETTADSIVGLSGTKDRLEQQCRLHIGLALVAAMNDGRRYGVRFQRLHNFEIPDDPVEREAIAEREKTLPGVVNGVAPYFFELRAIVVILRPAEAEAGDLCAPEGFEGLAQAEEEVLTIEQEGAIKTFRKQGVFWTCESVVLAEPQTYPPWKYMG